VLIRAIEVAARGERRRIVGPARVTRFLRIDGRTSGEDLTRSKALWIEDRGIRVPKQRIRAGPRVGVDYAGRRWAAKPWRFWIEPARSPRDPRSRRA
jgi:DNA-3-methyladenine glycosylase